MYFSANNGTGFTAYALEDVTYDAGDTIIFSEIILNRGNHYAPGSSIFTVPYAGVYLFTANIMSFYENTQRTFIVRNDEMRTSCLCTETRLDR